MNRKQYFKIYILVFIALYSEFNLANQEMFVNIPLDKKYDEESSNVVIGQNQCKTIENGISGRIVLENSNINKNDQYKNIVIRILGVDYTKPDGIFYEYYPSDNGCFNLTNIPIGSSIILKIWDTNNVYYSKTVNVYANANSSFYEIPLSLESKISSESRTALVSSQFYNKAGICGQAIGLPPGDLLGTSIYVENANKKIFQANYSNDFYISSANLKTLSMNGYFCVFNLDSCSKNEENCSDNPNYNLYFTLKNGEKKRFNLIIPATSFSDGNFFDLTAGVLRPTELYSLNDVNSYSWINEKDNAKPFLFNKLVLDNSELNKLSYFATGDNFIRINYSLLDQNNFNQFFIIKPKEEIYTQDMYNRIKNYDNYIEGEVFVDEKNPLKLKIFDPKYVHISKNTLDLMGNKKFGSIFFSLDLKKYNIDNSFVKIEVRNMNGLLVAESSVSSDKNNNLEIVKSNTLELNGVVHSLEPGLYQFFLKSKDSNNKEILFTTFIQSFSGRTQVVTEPFDQLSIAESLQEKRTYVLNSSTFKLEENIIPWNNEIYKVFLDSDLLIEGIIPSNNADINENIVLKNEIRNNIFALYSAEELCLLPKDLDSKNEVTQYSNQLSDNLVEIDMMKYYKS
ncbi:hypothetical protein QEJ31_08005 [Pigmentibacter sp. JX0631]|uniref:hypothetical protein n=1 Tax=Pigmentibacter sp. JX0631 TaxID=2976982 RepID=UPI002468AFD0|nr:hypothetical protein [Pigmentibacter sp. JX0631]WGL61532.1 hypothetical protein QEJ31_08005 [Pigmentibacter sp. JX0631]